MRTIHAAVFAIAAGALSPAWAQCGTTNKACVKRCIELTPADTLKKLAYDYEAVNNHATLTEAEKKQRHKRAVVEVCTNICTN